MWDLEDLVLVCGGVCDVSVFGRFVQTVHFGAFLCILTPFCALRGPWEMFQMWVGEGEMFGCCGWGLLGVEED